MEQHFGFALGALGAALRGVRSAQGFQVQLAIPYGQVRLAHGGFQPGKESLHRADLHVGHAGHVAQSTRRFEHLAGGAAPTVAPAKGQQHAVVDLFLLVIGPRAHHVVGLHPANVAVMLRVLTWGGDKVRQHLRAIDAAPGEGIVGEAVKAAPANHRRCEILYTGLPHQLRQDAGEAKRIGQPQHAGGLAEFVKVEALPEQELAH